MVESDETNAPKSYAISTVETVAPLSFSRVHINKVTVLPVGRV